MNNTLHSIVSDHTQETSSSPIICVPVSGESFSLKIAENRKFVIDYDAIDDSDSEGAGLQYSIIGGLDAALFKINPSNGRLSFINPPDFENPLDQSGKGIIEGNNIYEVTVAVTDSDGNLTSQRLSVEITDLLEPTKNTLRGTNQNDKIIGLESDDDIFGSNGNDTLLGRAGADCISGGNGDDKLYGNQGDDMLLGGKGADQLWGHAGRDKLIGAAGNDTIHGGFGDDFINGSIHLNAGADEIDVLMGGTGRDTFVLGSNQQAYYQASGNHDFATITDFSHGVDSVQLHGSADDYQVHVVGHDTQLLYDNGHGLELIAVFEGVTHLDLNAPDFRYTDPAQVVSVSDTSAEEGDRQVFEINLSHSSLNATALNFALIEGPATSSVDFSSKIQISYDGGQSWNKPCDCDRIDIKAGVQSFLARVATHEDTLYEGNETFSLQVSGSETTQSGVATIIDNEATPTAKLIGNTNIDEGSSSHYHVEVDTVSAQDREITLTIQDGTAHRYDNNAQLHHQIVNGASDGGFSWGYYTDGTNARDNTTVSRLGHSVIVRRDFSGRVPLNTTGSAFATQVGSSAQNWDFNVTQNGVLNHGSTITVTVAAGETRSNSFEVNAAKEQVYIDNFLSGNNNLGLRLNDHAVEGTGVHLLRNGFTRASSHETFSIQITDAGDAQIEDGNLEVNIQDKTHYQFVSPISFDLNGDGIQSLSVDKGVTFDILNTGKAVNTGWISGDDGFLAVDSNHDGLITSRDELFGGGVGEGFAKLDSFDSNQDGLVNESDARFNELSLWQDANENGLTDAGELVSLASVGISDLRTDFANAFTTDAQGNILGEVSSAKLNGKVIEMTDVYFQVEA